MAAEALITLGQMERRFGPETVTRYFDDTGNEEAEQPVEEEVRIEATQIAEGILKGGFNLEQMKAMAAIDFAFRGLMLDIAADVMARRRSENLDKDGNTPYTGIRNAAEKRLKEIAEVKVRLIAEETTGANQKLTARTNIDRTTFPFTFPPSSSDPNGPGGF